MGWLGRQIAIRILCAYHRFISPILPRACRFFPSCSVYASDAIRKHGLAKGTWLSLRRLVRCHPWNPGGFDPVN